MTFFISQDCELSSGQPLGMLVHVPKCGGSAIQKYIRDYGFNLSRPFPSMNHHRSFAESYEFSNRINLNLDYIILPWRNPIEWRLSIYNYALRQNPDVSFMPLEHSFFKTISFGQYLDFLLGEPTPNSPKLFSRSELPWNALWTWLLPLQISSHVPSRIYLVNSSHDVRASVRLVLSNEYSANGLNDFYDGRESINTFTVPSERSSIFQSLSPVIRKKLVNFDLGHLLSNLSFHSSVQCFDGHRWFSQ